MANGLLSLPEIPPDQRTPLVEALLAIICAQHDRIRQLEETVQLLRDEIAVLKGQKPRPKIAPSPLEKPPTPPAAAHGEPKKKRPGSDKQSKNAQLTITHEQRVPFPNPPAGSVSNGYVEYLVQELILRPQVTRYLRERILTPDGKTLLAPLPAEVLPGQHFGPDLIRYVLHQYHHNHVTQPLLLEELTQFGIVISAGQINNLLTQGKEVFHAEKAEVLTAGLNTASYIQVDDTGARHDGKNGYCTHIGNEFFAYFESTDSKSRINFLQVLRGLHTDYAINETALAYCKKYGLSAALLAALSEGPTHFCNAAAWNAHLQTLGITTDRLVRITTEGALLGSLIDHGVSPNLTVLSDGAGQFNILVHAACWIHAERPLARMIPHNEQHRVAIEQVRQQIWELYQDLKAYQQQPLPEQVSALTTRFAAMCRQTTVYPSINQVLKDMREHQADLLRVLAQPEVPLHNNASESDIRDYVKKRKISGSTRSQEGRRCRDTFASLKKTCRKLGVGFWDYLRDRIRGIGAISRLADMIHQRTKSAPAEAAPT
jgi:hypothetical protein